MMRVLVACEFSGVVREAFRKRGHNAWSCDILPAADESEFHLQCDVFDVLHEGWDLMIAHPPCTYLANSQWFRVKKSPQRYALAVEARSFFSMLWGGGIPKICVENPQPTSFLMDHVGKYHQAIQPYQFGENASKRTCLWLKRLPPLVPTKYCEPERVVNGRPRWGNQTDSGQNRLGPSADRGLLRSVTYQGIADAMGEQWG